MNEMNEMNEDRNKILSLQKEIMNSVLDYQIKHGAESVSWNVTISFMEKRK